jgi:hypothetical protein
MNHENDHQDVPASQEPIHELRAHLDFESESWAGTEQTSESSTDNELKDGLNFWHDAFDPAREMSAYHRLAIEPMRMNDLLSIWSFGSRSNEGRNIILDCEVACAKVDDPLEVLRTLHGRTVDLVGCDTAEGLLILDDDALALYAASFEIHELQMVRVNGPVDRGDITAMLENATGGSSILEAEMRSDCSAEWRLNGPTIIESRNLDMIAAALGADMARYVEAFLGLEAGNIPRPPQETMIQLLARTNSILVSPEDTQIADASIEIGIRSDLESAIKSELVYLRPHGIWQPREAA